MNRKFYISLLAATLLALGRISAQQLFFDGAISTDFDNTEYAGSECGTSRTIFAVRLTPVLGYRWNNYHSVAAGAEMLKDFGSKRFLDRANLVAYYQYDDGRFGANAGIFGRDRLVGRYSRAFYSDSALIYNSLVQGVAGRYTGRNSFAELAVDWEGLYSPDTREKFRILLAGGGDFCRICYAGASLSLQHFANRSTFNGNVVDYLLVNPYIGVRFDAFFAFDIRLGWLQSAQRDRMAGSRAEGGGWRAPCGGELYLRLSRWGVFVDNNLYCGGGLTPFYNSVGKDGLAYADNLYAGDPFYGTQHKIYNRTGIGYERAFAKERVRVRAEMVLQYDGRRMFCQQLVGISARICPTVYDRAKHRKQ